MLETKLPGVQDVDGARLPTSLPPVVDAHVHLFPDRLFAAIWRWFDEHGWPIRYPLTSPEALSFLFDRGVERVVALHYAHKPGIARGLNRYMAELAASEPRLVGTAMPGKGDIPLNVVPVDYVVEAGHAIARDHRSLGKTFHLVDPNPVTAREVFEWIALCCSQPCSDAQARQRCPMAAPSAASEAAISRSARAVRASARCLPRAASCPSSAAVRVASTSWSARGCAG